MPQRRGWVQLSDEPAPSSPLRNKQQNQPPDKSESRPTKSTFDYDNKEATVEESTASSIITGNSLDNSNKKKPPPTSIAAIGFWSNHVQEEFNDKCDNAKEDDGETTVHSSNYTSNSNPNEELDSVVARKRRSAGSRHRSGRRIRYC